MGSVLRDEVKTAMRQIVEWDPGISTGVWGRFTQRAQRITEELESASA
jgi:hypothetical protein